MLVAQDRVRVDLYLRDRERWILVSASGLGEAVDLEPLDCRIRLAEIYRGVEFEG